MTFFVHICQRQFGSLFADQRLLFFVKKSCYFSVYAKKSNKLGLRVGFRQLGSYKSSAVKLHHDLGYVWLVETFFSHLNHQNQLKRVSQTKAIRTHGPLYSSSIRPSQQDSLLYT
jgi:hypothetical protein